MTPKTSQTKTEFSRCNWQVDKNRSEWDKEEKGRVQENKERTKKEKMQEEGTGRREKRETKEGRRGGKRWRRKNRETMLAAWWTTEEGGRSLFVDILAECEQDSLWRAREEIQIEQSHDLTQYCGCSVILNVFFLNLGVEWKAERINGNGKVVWRVHRMHHVIQWAAGSRSMKLFTSSPMMSSRDRTNSKCGNDCAWM